MFPWVDLSLSLVTRLSHVFFSCVRIMNMRALRKNVNGIFFFPPPPFPFFVTGGIRGDTNNSCGRHPGLHGNVGGAWQDRREGMYVTSQLRLCDVTTLVVFCLQPV